MRYAFSIDALPNATYIEAFDNFSNPDAAAFWGDSWLATVFDVRFWPDRVPLFNAHSVLIGLKQYMVYNRARNADSMSLFSGRLSWLLKNDPSLPHIKSLKGLLQEIKAKISHGYSAALVSVTDRCIDICNQGAYLDALIDALLDLTNNGKTKIDEVGLRTIAQFMVLEFLVRGRTLVSAQHALLETFDLYRISENGDFNSWYPGVRNLQESSSEAKARAIENLRPLERIETLRTYLLQSPSLRRYILHVSGLEVEDDIKIDDVEFYNPYTRSRTLGVTSRKERDYYADKTRAMCATCEAHSVDEDSGFSFAEAKVQTALDRIRLLTSSAQPPFYVHPYYDVVDAEYHRISGGYSRFRFHHPTQLSSKGVSAISAHVDFEDDNLVQARHWLRKAHEAAAIDDAIVLLWTSIEKLVACFSGDVAVDEKRNSPAQIAVDVLPSLMVVDATNRALYACLESLREFANRVPDESMDATEIYRVLNSGSTEEIRACLTFLRDNSRRSYVRQQAKSALDILSDSSTHANVRTHVRDAYRDDLISLYSYRNLIAHNAQRNLLFSEVLFERLSELIKEWLVEFSSRPAVGAKKQMLAIYARAQSLMVEGVSESAEPVDPRRSRARFFSH